MTPAEEAEAAQAVAEWEAKTPEQAAAAEAEGQTKPPVPAAAIPNLHPRVLRQWTQKATPSGRKHHRQARLRVARKHRGGGHRTFGHTGGTRAPVAASVGGTTIERDYNGVRAKLTLPDRKMRRLPSANEIKAAVDFKGLDSAHEAAVKALHGVWLSEHLPGQIHALGDQIRYTANGEARKVFGKVAAARLTAPVLGVEDLAAHLGKAAESGLAAAVRELEAQGQTPNALAGLPSAEALAARIAPQAQAVAELNANALGLAAQRNAIALAAGQAQRDPQKLANALEYQLASMKHVYERQQLKGAVTMAQNQGRIAAFEAMPGADQAVYEASEMLDDRTCDECEAIDGTIFDSLDEAEEAYGGGGYVNCAGGPNCRGTLVAVYPEQNPVGGENDLREAEPPMIQPGEGGEPIPGLPSIPGVETPEVPIALPSAMPQTMDVDTARNIAKAAPGHFPDIVQERARQVLREEARRAGEAPLADRQPVETFNHGLEDRRLVASHEASLVDELHTAPISTPPTLESSGGHVNDVYEMQIGKHDAFVKPVSESHDAKKGLDSGSPRARWLRENLLPGRDAQREAASYVVAKEMGVPMPATTVRDVPGLGESVISHGVPNERGVSLDSFAAKDIHEIALYDAVVGNTDRHAGNWLAVKAEGYTRGADSAHLTYQGVNAPYRMIPFDHGLAFPDFDQSAWGNFQTLYYANQYDTIGTDLSKAETENLRNLLKPEVADALRETGISEDSIRLMGERVERMLDTGKLPEVMDSNYAPALFSPDAPGEKPLPFGS